MELHQLSIRDRYLFGGFGLFSLIVLSFTLAAPYWRNTSQQMSEDIYETLILFEGLWLTCLFQARRVECVEMGVGWSSAYAFSYPYDLSKIIAYLNAFRAFMIIALIASVSGVVCSALGMRCTTILEEEGKGKRYVVIAGGACHILSGLLTGISVSWYAAEVVREYYSPYYQNQKMKYTLGACLYVGWVSMVFSLVCGCLMVCCTCFNKPVDNTYAYKGSISKEKYSMPPPAVYKSDPYHDRNYHHQPDYTRPSSNHKSDRSHRSHRTHRDYYSNRRSSYSSSDRSPKSSRHESDVMRASGFV